MSTKYSQIQRTATVLFIKMFMQTFADIHLHFRTPGCSLVLMRLKHIPSNTRLKPEHMSVYEFAKLAGISPTTAYRWRAAGMLDSIDAGSGTLARAEVPDWIKRNVTPAKRPAK